MFKIYNKKMNTFNNNFNKFMKKIFYRLKIKTKNYIKMIIFSKIKKMCIKNKFNKIKNY